MNHTNVNTNFLLQSKNKVSGEISKEPFLDILYTTLEQSSFSLQKRSFCKQLGSLIKKSKGYAKLKVLQAEGNGYKSDLLFFGTRTIDNGVMLRQDSIDIRNFWRTRNHKQSSRLSNSRFLTRQNKDTLINRNAERKAFSRKTFCQVKVGDYVHSGDKISSFLGTPIVISESGKVLKISKTQITIQKMQPVLFYSQAEIHVENSEWVKRGTPILTLAHQTLVTGDIVQGIPRIEQLFEASSSPPSGTTLRDFDLSEQSSFVQSSLSSGYKKLDSRISSRLLDRNSFSTTDHNQLATNSPPRVPSDRIKVLARTELREGAELEEQSFLKAYRNENLVRIKEKPPLLFKTLQSQVRETFRKKWNKLPLPVAVRQSLEEIQQIIVESIQKVYLSQGVLIADKHIEIIVRQMTSKAQIFDSGSTGLLIDELLSLQQIENANISTPGQKALYIPVVMGLTQAALNSDSFVSAASFQETTRVLSRDAIAGKSDFLRGLKEKVIIGDLIDAGTGLDLFYIYPLFSKKIFQNKFKDIFNGAVFSKQKLLLDKASSAKAELLHRQQPRVFDKT